MKPVVHEFEYGGHHVLLETGVMAKQATAAVRVQMGETVLLVTVMAAKELTSNVGYFPLSVHYQERAYAAGKIPGSFFRREGRPSEHETLTARLIDRAIRPLFPKNFTREIQVIVTVLSSDHNVCPDIPSILGVSAALSISGLPFQGPVSAARIGYQGEALILNPTPHQRLSSRLDLVVACLDQDLLMVEASADSIPEEDMVLILKQALELQQPALEAIKAFAAQCDVRQATLAADVSAEAVLLTPAQRQQCKEAFLKIYQATSSEQDELKRAWIEAFKETLDEGTVQVVDSALASLERDVLREQIITQRRRSDGRTPETIRALDIRTRVLPGAHGSALFTRGETQALVSVTLGVEKEAKQLDDLGAERTEPFMFHYNFLPFCVGSIGMLGSPKRREIGHGRLAKRALQSGMPALSTFPYCIRVVSEILESNGSSSMASVCGASLALMDAGVPLSAPVAGVAMGLIQEGSEFVVLSDISAQEDQLGDMDFKVAGTEVGITALQMDLKRRGIDSLVVTASLQQARQARLHLLGVMKQVLDKPQSALSQSVPKHYTTQIPIEKIKNVIGKGGACIKRLSERFKSQIDISPNGNVQITSSDADLASALIQEMDEMVKDPIPGTVYTGEVVRITSFGAFVRFGGGKEGLLHISQFPSALGSGESSPSLDVGQTLEVRVMAIDKQGRVKLSMAPSETKDTDLASISTQAELGDASIASDAEDSI